MPKKIIATLFILFSLSLSVAENPYQDPYFANNIKTLTIEAGDNNLIYPKFWNLYNGGYVTETNFPGLKKAANNKEKWSATMKLNSLKVIKEYVGKTLYFITETTGEPVARLAPSFYILKNKTEYVVWWKAQEESNPARIYHTFFANSDGQIVGSLNIPLPINAVYYAQTAAGQIFKVTDNSPVTRQDITQGLRTDWQHDIPGSYAGFEGSAGNVVFQRFYLGLKMPELLLHRDRESWLTELSDREKEILFTEYTINERYATKKLAGNQYIGGSRALAQIKNYYQENKEAFKKDPYYTMVNYLPNGNSPQKWENQAKDEKTTIEVDQNSYLIKNKNNPNSWLITKIGEITELKKIKELQGVVRLSAQMEATGYRPGFFEWQCAYLDLVQIDQNGAVLASNDDLRFVVYGAENKFDYQGVFENELIISPQTKKIEVFLKIAGAPDSHPDKAGAVAESFKLSRLLLTKASSTLDFDALFREATSQPSEIKKEQVVYNGAQRGVFVGAKQFKINSAEKSVSFAMKGPTQYDGFYSNIFDVTKIEELEIAADFSAQLTKVGNPPEWASPTIELCFYNEKGETVYPADYGAEMYPKLNMAPAEKQQSLKSFFSVPRERGAKYAQAKIHFVRVQDEKTGNYDKNNYYQGGAQIKNIIFRPALELVNKKNIAPYDGSFYKHIDGWSISWALNGSVKIVENLKKQYREIVFENTDSDWSSLKNEFVVPAEAVGLRGEINIAIEKITAGLNQWEGFGFFIEADVRDQDGNLYHYSGIPVFKEEQGKLVLFSSLASLQKEKIKFYIPLYHEHLKMEKITWQLALMGKGKVKLLPLTKEVNSPLVKIEFLSAGVFPTSPVFWPQYGLNAVDAEGFYFQKGYELTYAGQKYNYDNAEVLADHLGTKQKLNSSFVEQIKKIELGESKTWPEFSVKTVPGYVRTEYLYNIENDAKYLQVSFKLKTADQKAKYNFRPLLLDNAGNSLEISYLKKGSLNQWRQVASTQDVFDVEGENYEFLIPLNKTNFKAKSLRLVFGSNQGEIAFLAPEIAVVTKVLGHNPFGVDELTEKMEFIVDSRNRRQIYSLSKNYDGANSLVMENKKTGSLDNSEFTPLVDNSQVRGSINLNDLPQLKTVDKKIRESIKSGNAIFENGYWHYDKNKIFVPVGFTIVGETFNKWFELRTIEFKQNNREPYWAAALAKTEQEQLKQVANLDEYIRLFMKSQARIWQANGYNIIRVHQLFASWSGLDEQEVQRTITLLKMLQQEEGFLVDFDLLPNPDFTGPYFGSLFNNDPLAADLSEQLDLFKASLFLPIISNTYVKPAVNKIFADFNKAGFWPNSLSYCNETGFTHGFWTIAKDNPAHNKTLSKYYHFYYQRYLDELKKDDPLIDLIKESQSLYQVHLQNVRLISLLADISAIKEMIKGKKRVKDNASYVYYNLLRPDVIAQYPFYEKELNALRNEGFSDLTVKPTDIDYYYYVNNYVAYIEKDLTALQAKIEQEEKRLAQKITKLYTNKETGLKINNFYHKVFAVNAVPASYKMDNASTFEYLDTFDVLNERQLKQAFFTSFLLPWKFSADMNKLIATKAPVGKNYTIGLNNDFTKDMAAIMLNAYLSVNDNKLERRFNKYTHHPVGGHSLLLNAGAGNLFDEDSAIAFNAALFDPLFAVSGMRLSETNYTFNGGDNSGEGNWALFDWLKLVKQKNQILGFQMGPNNVDKPVIAEYFNFGNRPNKLNALNLVAISALANVEKNDSEFKYDRFSSSIELESSQLKGLSGTLQKGTSLKGNDLVFEYNGVREKMDITVTALYLPQDKALYLTLYGIERNNLQRNREGNENLVQVYGTAPIIYQYFPGIIKVKVGTQKVKNLKALLPDGSSLGVSGSAYRQVGEWLEINLQKDQKKALSFLVEF